MTRDNFSNGTPKASDDGDEENQSVGLTVGDIEAQLEFQKYTDGIARVHRNRQKARAKKPEELVP